MAKKRNKKWNHFIAFKGALLKRLLGGMLFVVMLTTVLALLHQYYPDLKLNISASLPGYMGAALGLLLVFRNNTAYDKWWEARKEMGALVNTCRNLGITINGILPPENKDKNDIAKLTIGFVFALKEHLRSGVKMNELKEILDPKDYEQVEKASHKPNVIVNLMMSKIEHLYLEKHITDIQQSILIGQINHLIDILGRCERIRNTPIPMAYGFLLKFFIILYVSVLPLGMPDLGFYSIPMVIMLYYILMSIVLTAEEIEEPFGKDVNDLPMEQMAINIRSNIEEIVAHH